jgi:hypothetical protein
MIKTRGSLNRIGMNGICIFKYLLNNMAFFYDIVFNKQTGRHELEFVNQQFDYLMGIRFYDETGEYRLSVSEEEANRISLFWGKRKFDTDYWITLAIEELTKLDGEKAAPKSE